MSDLEERNWKAAVISSNVSFQLLLKDIKEALVDSIDASVLTAMIGSTFPSYPALLSITICPIF